MLSIRGFGWRRRAGRLILDKLDEIFPGPPDRVRQSRAGPYRSDSGRWSKSRAPSPSRLDGPRASSFSTSRRPRSTRTRRGSCLPYVRHAVRSRRELCFISHLLGEVLSTCDRIVVMRDGKVVMADDARNFDRAKLVGAMGGIEPEAPRIQAAAATPCARRNSGRRACAPRTTERMIEMWWRARARSLALRASRDTARPTFCFDLRSGLASARRRNCQPRRLRLSPETGNRTAFFRDGRSPTTLACGR